MPPVDGRFDLTLDWPKGTLVMARSPLSIAKLPLTFEGRVDGMSAATAPMRTSLRLRTEGDVPIDAVTGIAGMGAALPADVRLSGRVRLDVTIAGPSGALETRGAVDAAPLGVAKAGQALFASPAVHATLGTSQKRRRRTSVRPRHGRIGNPARSSPSRTSSRTGRGRTER